MRNNCFKRLLIIITLQMEVCPEKSCPRCCEVGNNVIIKPKVFSNALENGAADGALGDLESYIGIIRNSLGDNNEMFSYLYDNFATQKNRLPPQNNKDININSYRLSICNECFIVNELVVLLTTCYENYHNFLQGNQKEEDNFTPDLFKEYFIRFLKICDLIMQEALSNYKVVELDNVEENQLSNAITFLLDENNPFKIHDLGNEYNINIDDTIKIRNTIGDLFNIAFGKLIKYKLEVLFNNKKINDEEIEGIDGLSL